ncbi:sporulation protein YqfD [Solibacillus sp. CAU 1738]|uniref:sporulation protein YqfD n=1 Tax=Solibacillus sp. CAU 1738 TaxID=3140363 RepID=UPI00325FE995
MYNFNYRRIRVTVQKDDRMHELLQYLHSHHVTIRHVQTKKETLQFEISSNKLHVLRQARRKYRLKLKLRYTAPDVLLQKQLTTFIGLLCLWIVPIVCNEWMWTIDVHAETPEKKVAVERLLKNEFTAPLLKRGLPSDTEVRQLIMQEFREFSWVHVSKIGSKMTITPQLAPENIVKAEKDAYYHLVAGNSGVITHFNITSGERKVTPNTTVYTGDTLVSGVIAQGDNYLIVGAVGEVYADYWLETDFTVPSTVKYEVVTAEDWKVTFFDKSPETALKKIQLPSWLDPYIQIAEVETRQQIVETLTEENLESRILPLLHEKMIQSLPAKSRIKKENLLHVTFEDGKVKGKVLFLVNENIAKRYPIDQGE